MKGIYYTLIQFTKMLLIVIGGIVIYGLIKLSKSWHFFRHLIKCRDYPQRMTEIKVKQRKIRINWVVQVSACPWTSLN